MSLWPRRNKIECREWRRLKIFSRKCLIYTLLSGLTSDIPRLNLPARLKEIETDRNNKRSAKVYASESPEATFSHTHSASDVFAVQAIGVVKMLIYFWGRLYHRPRMFSHSKYFHFLPTAGKCFCFARHRNTEKSSLSAGEAARQSDESLN